MKTGLYVTFPVSENVARMQSSATMAAMQAAEALRATGANVCDFGPGEPDFDTPDNIKQAAERAMRAGRTKYTANAGIRELQRAIIDFYRKDFGTEYELNEVMATAGGKQAIFNAVVTLLNPGDEALIPKPYWVTFPEIAVFAGANLSSSKLKRLTSCSPPIRSSARSRHGQSY
jgi:aspartate aminotransferase